MPYAQDPSCMIGKSTLEDLTKLKDGAKEPLYPGQVNMDSFPSSVTLIEGYNYAIVFADSNSGYRWVYGVKKWFSDIADLRQKHKLVIVMQDNVRIWTGRSILVQGSIGCM